MLRALPLPVPRIADPATRGIRGFARAERPAGWLHDLPCRGLARSPSRRCPARDVAKSKAAPTPPTRVSTQWISLLSRKTLFRAQRAQGTDGRQPLASRAAGLLARPLR